MNGAILCYIKLVLVFCIYDVLILFINKYLMKKTTFVIRYFAMKIIPVMCLITLAVDCFFKNIKAIFDNSTLKTVEGIIGKISVISVDTNLVNPFIIKCFFCIWLIGVCLYLFRYCVEYFCFRRVYRKGKVLESSLLNDELDKCYKQLGVTGHIKIYYCKDANTPFTFGIFRPGIIIPADMSENLTPIILHEVTHCIHHDMLVKTVNELLKITQWFNPLVYFYTRELEKLCEFACDERVSKFLTFGERKKYAHEIINNARKHKYPIFLATFSSANNYKERLYNLLYPANYSVKKGSAFLILFSILIFGMGLFSLHGFNNSSIPELFANVIFSEESQEKIIKVNYLPGQEEEEYYYEEYIDGFWWRGTLLAESSKKVSEKLTEITFSGDIYKCEE